MAKDTGFAIRTWGRRVSHHPSLVKLLQLNPLNSAQTSVRITSRCHACSPIAQVFPALCMSGVVVPFTSLLASLVPVARAPQAVRRLCEAQRMRTRRAFPSNGGAATSRRRVLNTTAGVRTVGLRVYLSVPAGWRERCSQPSVCISPSVLLRLNLPQVADRNLSPRPCLWGPGQRLETARPARARGLDGTMLESIRVTGEYLEGPAHGLAVANSVSPATSDGCGSESRQPEGQGNGRCGLRGARTLSMRRAGGSKGRGAVGERAGGKPVPFPFVTYFQCAPAVEASEVNCKITGPTNVQF